MYYVVIGASRGLGAALVENCLLQDKAMVIGIGRSEPGQLADVQRWLRSGRFRYCRVDIAGQDARHKLEEISRELPPERVCIILNAAVIASDMQGDGRLMGGAYDEVSQVPVTGLGQVLSAFGEHLRAHRGILVGISSTVVWSPLLADRMIAYPASKAFLTAALRSLRLYWRGKVDIMTVYLGHVGRKKYGHLPFWIVPSYEGAAQKIVQATGRSRVPSSISYPFITTAAYRILGCLPDSIANRIFAAARNVMG